MYIQGDPDYESHLKEYGHPSTNGFKDIKVVPAPESSAALRFLPGRRRSSALVTP